MRRTLIALALFCVPATALAAAGGQYVMKGPCRVRSTSGIPFDRTYEPELHAKVSGPDSDLRIEISGEGVTCTVKGKKKGSKIELPQGQKCPVHVVRDGIEADVDGVLKSGSGTMSGKELTLVTHWDVDGTVKLFKDTRVTGVVDANVKGKRK